MNDTALSGVAEDITENPATATSPDNTKADDKSTSDKADDKSASDKTSDDVVTYDDFTLPDGHEVNEAHMSRFKEVLTKGNVTKETAQELLDLQLSLGTEALKDHSNQWDKIREGWLVDAKEDKEVGGTDFDTKLGVAGRALNKFGTPELITALNLYGMGDHPEMIRFMYRMGKTITEDTTTKGKNEKEGVKDHASVLYPNQGQTEKE